MHLSVIFTLLCSFSLTIFAAVLPARAAEPGLPCLIDCTEPTTASAVVQATTTALATPQATTIAASVASTTSRSLDSHLSELGSGASAEAASLASVFSVSKASVESALASSISAASAAWVSSRQSLADEASTLAASWRSKTTMLPSPSQISAVVGAMKNRAEDSLSAHPDLQECTKDMSKCTGNLTSHFSNLGFPSNLSVLGIKNANPPTTALSSAVDSNGWVDIDDTQVDQFGNSLGSNWTDRVTKHFQSFMNPRATVWGCKNTNDNCADHDVLFSKYTVASNAGDWHHGKDSVCVVTQDKGYVSYKLVNAAYIRMVYWWGRNTCSNSKDKVVGKSANAQYYCLDAISTDQDISWDPDGMTSKNHVRSFHVEAYDGAKECYESEAYTLALEAAKQVLSSVIKRDGYDGRFPALRSIWTTSISRLRQSQDYFRSFWE